MEIVDWLLTFIILVMVYGIIMVIRNHIIMTVRNRLLDDCVDATKKAIRSGNPRFRGCFNRYDKLPSYDSMMWSLNKWTYKSFKPKDWVN